MNDYSAGHITSEEGREIVKGIQEFFKDEEGFRFNPGVSYRHLFIVKKDLLKQIPQCTPPHDITDQPFEQYLPCGEGSALLNDLMERAVPFLADHPVNRKRIQEGKRPANMIWIWSGGVKPGFSPYRERFGIQGKAITAVDLVRGIAFFAGIPTLDVPGITGYYDTNYKGKADYAIKALEESDIVFIHVEAPDEASHNGHTDEKVKAIEHIDRIIAGPLLKALRESGEYRILVLPDHYTPLSIRTHREGPVPFVMCGTGIEKDSMTCFSEKEAERGSYNIEQGHTLIEKLIKG
jgi:2,3-bisphosphoglycerate-independent phosphoglycerate mutase